MSGYDLTEKLLKIKSGVPAGKSGSWEVEKFTITEAEAKFERMRHTVQAMQGRGFRAPDPGNYTKLTRNGECIMSDTTAEMEDMRSLVNRAEGNVLIHGLGLGLATEICLQHPAVKSVTVIERSEDVLKLVEPYLTGKYSASDGRHQYPQGRCLTIIQADAFVWRPPKGVVYETIWSDIWDNLCTDNIAEFTKLRRIYCRKKKWHGFWCETDVQRLKMRGW
jgi:hypothetical protein